MAIFSPTPDLVALVGLGLLVLYSGVRCYLNYRMCPQVKGPFLASISGLWLFMSTYRSRIYLDCADELDKYGTLARIAPNKIVTNDPVIWTHLAAPRSNFRKGTWYDSMTLDPNHKNSLSQRDEKEHNILRAKMIRGYSGKDIPQLESNIQDRVVDVLNLIRREMAKGKPVDIARIAQFFTLDVLTQIAFEKPFGYLSKNEDVFNYVHEVSGFLHVLEFGSNFPFIQNLFFSKLMSGMQPRSTDKTGMGAMLGVAERVAKERFAPGAKQHDDMLGSFIKHGMTQDEIVTEAMLQILGGSDSTATAVRTTFLYILTNPIVYAKLVNELDTNAHRLSSPVLTTADSQSLPYLQACIKEGLRIFPPLTGLQGKIAPPGGETVNGYYLPEGIEVCWCPHSMQRRKEVYGEDVDMYRPERWLEAAALDDGGEKIGQMNRTIELVFGAGRYGCLGKTVARLELDRIFAALFQNFEFSLLDPFKPMSTKSHGVHIQLDLWVKATERKPRSAGFNGVPN
ncbi:pisatin demethylase [Exophiala viscosa]|uniref:Pisatin demethylase n=1 Tax=Exophiala viscosa TaxID=2486360 RepID=A0AAN6ICZ5_9EURO|nr:pisatin demethylase [Exophiala viscosa]KAI1625990.1 pisatin demethylase [Exophiala viscosa]